MTDIMIVTTRGGGGFFDGVGNTKTPLGKITPGRILAAAQGVARRRLFAQPYSRIAFSKLDESSKGALFSVDLDRGWVLETEWFGLLFVQDPSQPKEYAISVPPDMRTVNEALLWTFNLSTWVFAPTIHT